MHEMVRVGGGRRIEPLDALARQHDVFIVAVVVHNVVLTRAITAHTHRSEPCSG
jgi:hypothetical protein